MLKTIGAAAFVLLLSGGAASAQTVEPPLSNRSAVPGPEAGKLNAPTPPDRPQPPARVEPQKKPPALDLDLVQTNDLSLVYFAPSETYLTPHVAKSFENSFAFQQRTFDWKPWERTTVLLKDFSDYGNAGARASPNNALLVDIAPLSQTYETFSAGERFYTLMNHELTHVATMDVWNSRDAFWRKAFHGKPMPLEEHPESILYNYLTTPRVNVPRWYLEGSAVFMETWMAGGFGRAQGAYDEMVFRSKVRDDAKFYQPLGLESEGTQIDFQVGVNAYLYGTRFMSWLALTYGADRVVQWLKRDEGSRGYYSLQFRHVFGKSLDSAWKDWIAWEHTFQAQNLKSVSKFPLTPLTKLTPTALGSISRSFYDPQAHTLVGAFRYPGVIGHMGVLHLDTGHIRRLKDIKGAMLYRVTSTAYDPESKTAWYTTDNYAYRDIVQLDVKTGKAKEVIHDGRIGDIVFNPKDKSLWGLRHLNGYVTLVQIPAPYTAWRQVHTFGYGQVLFDPDISPDGSKLSVSFGEVNGDQSIRVYDLATLGIEEPKPTAQFSLGASTPEGFVFSPDGKALFGSAYYTGVSNLYRYDFATGKTDAVTNVDTGLFRPIPLKDGSVIAYSYTGDGFTPVKLDPKPLEDVGAITFLGAEVARTQPLVKTWAVGSPAKVPLDDLVTNRGKYVPGHEIRLEAIYPVLEGYKNKVAGGVYAIFEDPLQLNQITTTLSYSPGGDLAGSERLHADVQYRTIDWRLEYWHNDAGFYDLFGPTDRSRRGDAFIGVYKKTPIYDPPRQLDLTASIAVYTGLDTLPQAQNIALTGVHSDIASAAFALHYTNTDKSLGAVDHERGVQWTLDTAVDGSDGSAFPKLRGGFNFGFPLPLKHSSFWLYSSAGIAGGGKNDPLTDFYFGGFGNNYVDDGEVKRYREYDSFPGFRIDDIAAKNFAKTVAELNLPPIRFSDIGRPSLYLSSLRPALFAGALAADPGFGRVNWVETFGGQLDFNFTVALRLPMVFSVGYAAGFDRNGFRRDEVLASLKIL